MCKEKRFWAGILFNHIQGAGRKFFENLNSQSNRNRKFGYISTFEFNLSGNLETHIFENADVDWLHCIAAHRKKKMFIEVEREMARYDIIAGKIADDATNATLTAYLAGAFGTAGDKEADDFCIRQLLPNKLKDQYCFKTESAIRCLKFVKGEKIWLK